MSYLLHPYYLQQMGIERWVLKTTPMGTFGLKLLVLGKLPDEDSRLFKKMLHSIGVSIEEITIVSVLDEQTVLSSIQMNRPRALWVMGSQAMQSLRLEVVRGCVQYYHGLPLVVSDHPTDLRCTPIKKKQAYHDLLLLAQVLC